MDNGFEIEARQFALRYVESLQLNFGDKVPASDIKNPILLDSRKVHLASFAEGVFRPKGFKYVLSVLSTLSSRYTDQYDDEAGLLKYAHSPRPHLNEALRQNWRDEVPLIALMQVTPKPNPEYMMISPVFVSGEANGYFFLSTLEAKTFKERMRDDSDILIPRSIPKGYRPISTQLRLHQAAFRKEILSAYRTRCCICELKSKPLLDASHIIPDISGEAHVRNGLCLCAIHHRAYDAHVLNIRPDYTVQISERKISGPKTTIETMFLRFKNSKITLPAARELHPEPDYLARREGMITVR